MKIGILSREPESVATTRIFNEAKKRGHEVDIINYTECYGTVEQSNPIVRYEGEDLGGYDAIIPRIAQSYTKYGTAIVRQFEMQGVFTTASSIAISRSRDKLRSMQLLARAGVGVPKTLFASETSAFDDVIAQLGGAPLIVKVTRGTQGNGVVLAETNKAAKAVMQAFYVEGVNFLVQEFVKESAGTDIRAVVVGNRVVASYMRQSLDEDFRSNIHQGGVGKPIKITDEERHTAIKAARATGLPVCGVDMMRSDRGPLVLEVNSSPGLEGVERTTGRNVAEKIIEYIELNAKRRSKKDRIGA
ncbi:MAG TPA: 30S ribosomal protein S6--L-glutamate ligase [Candidatus Saccharimonadales bacterium]|nr:30S ribosomal protein S6--L-glutamate ligase [Candidatus Saccharimonadales bacterium]